MTKPNIGEWEQVEIERSAAEAAHIDASRLLDSESNIAKYLNPPANTSYPLEYAYHLLGDVRGRRVLDLGCGWGENTLLLARRGALVYGMDISDALLKVARQRMRMNGVDSGVTFFVSSAHDIALEDESVDVVFGIAILHHLELAPVAREVKRVLRPGGRAIFQEPVRNSKLMHFVRNLIPYRDPEVSPFERPLTDHELEEFAAGFTSYRSRAFTLPYINLARILPGARRYTDNLYHLDKAILQKLPPLGYYATTRVVEMVK